MPPGKRRKSVTIVEPTGGPSTRRRNLLADAPAPAAAQKRAAPAPAPPAQTEEDDGFKFKRRKPANKPAAKPASKSASKAARTPAPAPAPAPRSTRATRTPAPAPSATLKPASAPTPAPAVVAESVAPVVAAREAERTTDASEPPARAVVPPAVNLDGVTPEMLRALLQACHTIDPGDATSDEEAAETQRAVSLCMHEIRRQGVFQVEAAGENEVLRKREAALQRCVDMLGKALGQWRAASEMEPARLGAHAPPLAVADLGLPALPNLSEALAQLQTVSALHADQVEATLHRLSSMCDESASQRRRMATAAHHASFGGYLDVNEPRMLIRSLISA